MIASSQSRESMNFAVLKIIIRRTLGCYRFLKIQQKN